MIQQKNSKLFLVLFLGTLSAFGPFVTDLYLPALPIMENYFKTTTSLVQLTLTGSMLGLALGQLLIGPISDKYGRKLPLTISLLIYLASTILIIFSPNIYIMIILRLIQGLASAGALVISRAISADLFKGSEMTKFFGLLMAVNGLAPIISPIFGSFLLKVTNWQGVFVTLAIIGIILLLANTKLVESLSYDKRLNMPIIKTYGAILKVFKNKTFIILVFIQAFSFAAMFAYIAASPFILQTHYGLSSLTYSFLFALNGIAIVIGSKSSSNFRELKSLSLGLILMLAASSYLMIALTTKLSVIFIELGFFLLMLGLGFILPVASSLAMNLERKFAGSASAVLGFFPFFLGGVVSPIVGLGNIFYSTPITIFICSALAYILFVSIKKNIK